MASVKKVQTIADFKRSVGTSKLNVFKSKAGNKYATDDSAELVAWVDAAADLKKELIVFSMQEGDDTWNFIANGEYSERQAEATL